MYSNALPLVPRVARAVWRRSVIRRCCYARFVNPTGEKNSVSIRKNIREFARTAWSVEFNQIRETKSWFGKFQSLSQKTKDPNLNTLSITRLQIIMSNREETLHTVAIDEEAQTTATTVKGLDSHSDPFAPREGKTLTWKNVNMVLGAKGDEPERKLLDNVWGEVPAKQTTALMGPSGAGKFVYWCRRSSFVRLSTGC